MTHKRGHKSRRGGQTDDDMEGETDPLTSTSTSTSTTTAAMDTTAMGGSRSRKHRRSVLYAARSGGRSRRRRGGQSAAAYEMNTVGNGGSQWNNVFNNPQTMNAPTRNGLWSADLTQNVNGVRPSDPSLGKLMQGGKRRHKRSRRGGNLMDIVSQAAVPFGLLGLQQTYSKRRRGGRKSRRHSRRQLH